MTAPQVRVLGVAMSPRAHIRAVRCLEMVADAGGEALLVTNQSAQAQSVDSRILVVDVGLPSRWPLARLVRSASARALSPVHAGLVRRSHGTLGHVRPWQLARYTMRHRLAELDPQRLDLVVLGDELAAPLAWRLVRRFPDVTVTGIINREQLDEHVAALRR